MKSKPSLASAAEISLRFLDGLLGPSALKHVAFRLWDGTHWPDAAPRAATLVLNHPGALRRMFGEGTEIALAEAYLHADFDIAGDLESALELADVLATGPGWKKAVTLAWLLRKLPASPGTRADGRSWPGDGHRHSRARDREAIAFHYDVSNDFYRLWLDQRMVYSCAYFETEAATLDAAQAAKLDYLCRKLRLRADQTVLDIGCGWGGFAVYAARNYGAKVTGVTLSPRQAAWATACAEADGLRERVHILLRDYRDLPPDESFDAIVSVGMAEHVGLKNLPAYFRTACALLKPGGVFLNHAIGEGCRYRPSRGPSFIDRYVFPDTDLPPIRAVTAGAEAAGFDVRDVENLREHYALTLRHWVRRLETRREPALAFVNEPTYRVWRLYMAGSAHGFAQGRLALYQTLLAKPDAAGHAGLPLTRAAWYDPAQAIPNP